jgi:hypothetical protein
MAQTIPTVGQVRRTPVRPSETVRLDHRRSRRPAHAPLRTHPARSRPPGPPMMKPCLDCGTPSDGNRCPKCHGAHTLARNTKQTGDRKMNGGRPQYAGGWAAYSKAIRQTATTCHLCGQGPKPDDPWQADHLIPAAEGGGAGPARAAHRSCNIRRANRSRNQPATTPPTRHPEGTRHR